MSSFDNKPKRERTEIIKKMSFPCFCEQQIPKIRPITEDGLDVMTRLSVLAKKLLFTLSRQLFLRPTGPAGVKIKDMH